MNSVRPDHFKLLDCTLRDGGYYNSWDFSEQEAQDYIDNLTRAGVDIIELGFRFTPKSEFCGPFAYSSEAFLRRLTLPENVQFGVMINASDYLGADWKDCLERNFVPEADSAVSLVRIAAHIGQLLECDKIVAWLKDQGYDVGLNVMQISQASNEMIVDLITSVERDFCDFEALYFADSLGNLTTDDVRRIVGLFRAHSQKPIGFHGHDNIGLGVANSLAAMEAGASWVDATVTGMGRGAGNTQTEYLALEMAQRNLHSFSMLDLQRAATGWLADLKLKCQWGTNLYYYEAGLRSLHPSYVQQMLGSQKYQPLDILVMIDALSRLEAPTSYRTANIDKALASLLKSPEGQDDMTGRWAGRPVLLIADGPNGRRHHEAVMAYARKHDAVCLTLNYVGHLAPDEIEGAVCIHPARMMHLLSQKDWNPASLFTAVDCFPPNLRTQLQVRNSVVDYGISVETGEPLQPGPKGARIPKPEVLAYAWALALQAGASEILLAGLDGYDGQSRAFQTASALIAELRDGSDIPVASLTETHFDVPVRAIYSV
ncbi:aldolase catalytic domain-containing protein [Aestuariivita sp.]|jgi:4-hydroxy 2-oxovalerate aldolase|uniref:aldolase catalytic domain-containing protein n=1 Tax=Aestuariivita sp. TaxID=1872407 RepID=UPI00216D21B5|nr:aldolase catalytic domain-containing protein [Aestuariivita sp.]MCE8009733.1 hypothetical protein [Aestuariivita sp.]